MPDEYAALQTEVLAALTPELTDGEFDDLALRVHRFQRKWNAPYARWCATRPAPRSWREIPAVPQSAFKSARLSVASPERIARTFRTSGTTGEGYGEHHFIDTRLYDAAVLAGWDRLGLHRGPYIFLVPGPWEAPHSSLSHMMQTLARERSTMANFRVSADGEIGFQRIREWLAEFAARPAAVAFLGTALAFVRFFELCAEAGITLPLPPACFAMETGGYKGSGREIPKAELYAMFGEYLGLAPDDIINEYGMTELSSQFYTRGLGGVHEGPPWARAVVIDPETGGEAAVGETGVLRIFDLANLGSVLAVETQDLAVRREGGFELLGRDPAAIPRGCSRAADERMRG